MPSDNKGNGSSPLSIVSGLVRQCDDLLPRAEERAKDSRRINRLNDWHQKLDRTIRAKLQKGLPVDKALHTLESIHEHRDRIAKPFIKTRCEAVAFINGMAEFFRILPLEPQVSLIRDELEKVVNAYVGRSASFVSLTQACLDLKVIRVRLGELQRQLLASGEVDKTTSAGTAKSLRIPDDLGAELAAAIKKRGDTREEACQRMASATETPLDPKTLLRVIEGRGRIHSGTLRRVRAYLDDPHATPARR